MNQHLRRLEHETFSALSIPNYRLYFSGQSVSLIGTWMQMTAQSWLVLSYDQKLWITHLLKDAAYLPA